MKRVAVVGFDGRKEVFDFIHLLKQLQKTYSFTFDSFIYSEKHFNLYNTLHEQGSEPDEYDAVISLGGDGTFLYTARIFAGTDVPLFGVNMGRLGFNTTITLADFTYYFDLFMSNKASYDYKSLLDVEVDNEIYSVLNEGVISHTGISRMIRLKVTIEGHSVCDFSGDGLIVSSPTGSTAYNLSAGGPILYPNVNAFVVSPICPHTLAIRPFILPYEEQISITIMESSAEPQITLDGQKIILLDVGQKVIFTKSDKMLKVIRSKSNFSDVLKQKLGWVV